MGTRNLTCVVLDGKYRIAQYGQWDGYFEGQGAIICDFIVKQLQIPEGLAEFKERVASVVEISKDAVGAQFDVNGKEFQEKWPWLDRDCGGKILQYVMDHTGLDVQLSIEFASDGLFCEFAYVVNLDNETLEIYNGYNTEPLPADERFASFDRSNPEYSPVKHYRTIPLSEITLETMANLTEELKKQNEMLNNTSTTNSDDAPICPTEHFTNDDDEDPIDTKSTIVVYKYSIDLSTTDHKIEMPEGAKLLHVHSSVFWALVDTSKPMVKRRIASVATGVPIDLAALEPISRFVHIGSAPLGGRVYHIFDCGEAIG